MLRKKKKVFPLITLQDFFSLPVCIIPSQFVGIFLPVCWRGPDPIPVKLSFLIAMHHSIQGNLNSRVTFMQSLTAFLFRGYIFGIHVSSRAMFSSWHKLLKSSKVSKLNEPLLGNAFSTLVRSNGLNGICTIGATSDW